MCLLTEHERTMTADYRHFTPSVVWESACERLIRRRRVAGQALKRALLDESVSICQFTGLHAYGPDGLEIDRNCYPDTLVDLRVGKILPPRMREPILCGRFHEIL